MEDQNDNAFLVRYWGNGLQAGKKEGKAGTTAMSGIGGSPLALRAPAGLVVLATLSGWQGDPCLLSLSSVWHRKSKSCPLAGPAV